MSGSKLLSTHDPVRTSLIRRYFEGISIRGFLEDFEILGLTEGGERGESKDGRRKRRAQPPSRPRAEIGRIQYLDENHLHL